MNQKELHESLNLLQTQVQQLNVSEEKDKIHIVQLIEELEKQIENPSDIEQTNSLHSKIPNLIERFEVEHPRITETLNRVMVALSDMGI